MHTHTKRCGHAYGDDEQYVLAAIDAGFKQLGFSEHIGYTWFDIPTDRMLYRDTNDYLTSIYHLKEKYRDRIDIKVGFEIEYYDNEVEFLKDMRERCDYMIVGQHCKYVDGFGFDYLCRDEDVRDYADLLCKAMRSGLVSCVAHPDYFMLGRRSFSEACVKAAHQIAQCAVECDVLLEINLKGRKCGKLPYIEGDAYPYPYRPFWEIIAQYPVQCVYGYDAHVPVDLLDERAIMACNQLIEGLDLNFVDEFKIKQEMNYEAGIKR